MTSSTDTPNNTSERLLPLHRQPGFLSFLLSRLAAVFAMQIQAIVVAWQVYDITRDPMALAYVARCVQRAAADAFAEWKPECRWLLRGPGTVWRGASLYRPRLTKLAAQHCAPRAACIGHCAE